VLPAGTGAAMPTSTGVTPLNFEVLLQHEKRHALRMLDRVRREAGIRREDGSLCLARGEAAGELQALAARRTPAWSSSPRAGGARSARR
jgi:hypothetical protein